MVFNYQNLLDRGGKMKKGFIVFGTVIPVKFIQCENAPPSISTISLGI